MLLELFDNEKVLVSKNSIIEGIIQSAKIWDQLRNFETYNLT